jgi:Fic family protein
MNPPFKISNKTLSLCTEIFKIIGKFEAIHTPAPTTNLRRQNKIRTIQGSLAIEGNSLDLDQVTAILDNRRVLAKPREILEVRNAIKAYVKAASWNPFKVADLLNAHKVMMSGLIPDAGKYRTTNVGIIKGSKIGHVAPQPKLVPALMKDLLGFLKQDNGVPNLVKACIFHYKLEFIHPFSDGNGRMGLTAVG